MASSSRKRSKQGNPAEHPRLGPAVVAKCLKFTDSTHKARFEKLQKRPITATGCLDLPILTKLQIWDEVAQYINNGHLGNLYKVGGPSYYELTMEFLSTFTLKVPKTPDEKCMTFRLLNQNFKLSITEFNRRMEFYTDDYMETEEYINAPLEIPSSFSDSQFWNEIAPTGGNYNSSRSKASLLGNPVLRYMQRYLALTLACRGESQGVVSRNELFYLFCMVNNSPLNVGAFLVSMLYSHTNKAVGELMMGSFITHLAIGVGVITEADVFGQTSNALTKVCDMRPLNEAYLLRMRMITKTPSGNCYLVRYLEAGAGEATRDDKDDDQPEGGDSSHVPPGPQEGMSSAEYLQLRAQMDILNDNQQQMRQQMHAQLDIIRANQDEMRNQLNLLNASIQSYFTQFPPPPPPQ